MTEVAEVATGLECSVRLRVRYPETDRMGVAYHAHYLVWFELGRTEWMRERGVDYGTLEERDGIFFPVVEASVRYRRSATYDDELVVRTRLREVGASRVRFEYTLLRERDDETLATAFTQHAAVGRTGRPMRLPAGLRRTLIDGRSCT